jgi:DNA polymerase I
MHDKIASISKAMALSVASDLPLEHSFAPVTSRIVDSLLIRRFDKKGFAVPQNNWNNKAKKIKGATVFEVFKPGIYHNVGIFDFKSMYPSVMIKNNICPTTFTKTETGDSVRSPLGVYFRLDKESIVPKILKALWEWRDATKLKIEKNGDYNDRLQYSIKVLMNSFYGVMASDFYRFTNPSIGGSITAFARKGIQDVYDELESRNYTTIYGDTDSVFVQLTDDDPHELAKELSARGLEMELEKILSSFFTHGAKKRYAATVEWPKKEFYVKGYELKRGDSFKRQREVLEQSLRLILDSRPDDALKLVTKAVKEIKNGEVDLEDLIVTKSVRSPSEYVNPDSNAGVQAAAKLQARGYPWLPGTKISWVVSNSKQTPMEVEPYIETTDMNVKFDRDYYADRLVRTMSDIAGVFDWDDMGLRSGTKQLRLF